MFCSYANGGREATGKDRWSLGGRAWIPELNDMTLSYRFTRSGEFGPDGNLTSLDINKATQDSETAETGFALYTEIPYNCGL